MGMLEESERYFLEVALPSLRNRFPHLVDRVSAGLVGNGSECYGFDDQVSLDHDCGVDFCIWVADADEGSVDGLRAWKKELFETQPPSATVVSSAFGSSRDPITSSAFYRNLIGTTGVPEQLREWTAVPEENLSLATNGKIFYDHEAGFAATREGLLAYLPESLRRKRIAARCMEAGQAGQYNLERMGKRGDAVAVQLCKTRFAEAAMSVVFMLNRVYAPYYKWQHRMLCSLPLLGEKVGVVLTELSCANSQTESGLNSCILAVEEACAEISEELRNQSLSSSHDPFLVAQGLQVQERIEDSRLAALPAQLYV